MRVFKKSILIVITFTFVLIMIVDRGFSAGLPESAATDARTAAIQGIKYWLKVIPGRNLKGYGFSNKTEFTQATLGKPIRVYTIQPQKILHYKGEGIAAIISATDERWFFPVLVKDRYRTILIIVRRGGTYKAVGIGYAGLARELNAIAARWPASKGYNIKLVRVYQAFCDFVLLEGGGEKPALVPLESANRALGLKTLKTRSIKITGQQVYKPIAAGSLMPKLKTVVEKTQKK
jgi:hypothetical protein